MNSQTLTQLQESSAFQQAIELHENGQINLPDQICQRLNWNPGDRLILTLEPDETFALTVFKPRSKNSKVFSKTLLLGLVLQMN